ncbi:MAG: carbon starvation protein A [Proteobacteria bacterium]|nr:carbon starvation protein A [Pseudomonadota bacterium]
MNALTLVFVAVCVFAIAYRTYGLFIANKVLNLDTARTTPAVKLADGQDYVKTNKYYLYGHHFAAIAAAGPLLGPVLAAQFGYLPGALWILIGAVLAGAVHDMIVLFASVRHKGRSLAYIASKEVGKPVGIVASWAVLFILILTLAGLSIAVVNAMFESAWGTFTVFATIPIALIMGVYLQYWRVDDVKGASILGVALLFVAILIGPYVASHPALAGIFTLSKKSISLAIPIYGFFASVLPVWLLLCPRDYLSTYLKIGTVVMLAGGIAMVQPTMLMPAITQFANGGGPIIGGPVIPFMFITIACGAISGFHAIIGTGTTPKMIGNERDILFVGYGAMLTEGFVAIMALIAACTLVPADYFAINAPPAAFAKLGMQVQDLPMLAAAVQENLAGRPGGAVSLAVGMAHVFSQVPFMKGLMAYWYHFAIMFEAVFILTAVDAGTRVGRFFLQEMIGTVIPKFNDKAWWPGIISTSFIFTGAWGYLVYTGDISTIWPLFGMSNQLLASSALIICTAMLIRMNKAKYAWITAIPGLLLAGVTMWAGYLQITTIYIPQGKILLATLACIVLAMIVVVLIGSIKRWIELLQIRTPTVDAYGDTVLVVAEE